MRVFTMCEFFRNSLASDRPIAFTFFPFPGRFPASFFSREIKIPAYVKAVDAFRLNQGNPAGASIAEQLIYLNSRS